MAGQLQLHVMAISLVVNTLAAQEKMAQESDALVSLSAVSIWVTLSAGEEGQERLSLFCTAEWKTQTSSVAVLQVRGPASCTHNGEIQDLRGHGVCDRQR